MSYSIEQQRKDYPLIDNAYKAYTASLKQLLENNHYLLKRSGKTLLGQFRELREQGIKLDRTTYYETKREKYLSRNIFLPYYIADYWDIPVKDMLFEDLEVKARIVRESVFGFKSRNNTEKNVQ